MNKPIHAAAFLSSLRPHASLPLVFEYGGRRTGAGYHVTEIMWADVRSMDCGGNFESRQETVVQLWDPPAAGEQSAMSVGKFLSVWDRVAAELPLGADAALLFECGDGAGPAFRHTAGEPTVEDGALVVRLDPVRAACKPRERRLATPDTRLELHVSQAGSCCTPQDSAADGRLGAGCC